MGPIYGTVFCDMAEAGDAFAEIGTKELATMLDAGLEGLYDIVEARQGDKTLVDALYPAAETMKKAAEAGTSFASALEEMKTAAQAGKESTKSMVAKFGRSSRLGKRSRGVLDAGATSCCIILTAIADGILEQL